MAILTVIVCTYNRSHLLVDCINSIINQSVSCGNYNILIVDNNSTDKTEQVLAGYSKNHSNFIYVKEVQQGISFARNRGALEAHSMWLAFLDDDSLAHYDFVEKALEIIALNRFDCFGGIYHPWYKYGKPKWIHPDFGRKIPLSDTICEIHSSKLDGGIFAIKREVLLNVGMFNDSMGMKGNMIAYGEETLLQQKLLENGYKSGFSPFWQMDHLVAKYKLSIWWHLRAEFAKGRDSMILQGISPIQWSFIDKLKFIIHTIILQSKKSINKLPEKSYYIQNALFDIFQPICFRFGQQSILKSFPKGKNEVDQNSVQKTLLFNK
jgi:glycosyltransferase involved in cell wall biosynthesis